MYHHLECTTVPLSYPFRSLHITLRVQVAYNFQVCECTLPILRCSIINCKDKKILFFLLLRDKKIERDILSEIKLFGLQLFSHWKLFVLFLILYYLWLITKISYYCKITILVVFIVTIREDFKLKVFLSEKLFLHKKSTKYST